MIEENINLDFPVTEQYSKEDVKKVQKKLLEMAKITKKILEENNIKYFITFGTLLGAVRHDGFIPWDDDFDLFLFDEDYDDAINLLRDRLPNWIVVHDKKTDPIYWPAWSRLRDINSNTRATLFPDDNSYKYRGINLDLYRLKKIDSSDINKYRYNEKISFLKRKHASGLIDNDVFLSEMDEVERRMNNLEIEASSKDEKVYSFVILVEKLKETDIFPLKKYKFEDTYFYGPNNFDELLKQAYGDYMKIPPYENRKPHYDRVEFYDE